VQFFIVTRYLKPEEIGLTRVLVDAAMLFSSLAQLGANSSIVRFFPYFKDGRNNHGIFGLSVLLPLAGFVLFSLAFLIFREPLLTLYSEKSPLLADYFYMVPMLTFFALYMTVFETNASVLLRITVPKLVHEVGIRLFTLAAYLLYGFGLISLDVFVWLFCGSYGLAMVLNLLYLLSLGRISFRVDRHFLTRGKRREIVRYTFFMTAVVLAGNIPLINSLFLGAKAGLALTGVYTIASYIANVVEVPYRSLGAISRPVIATAVKEEQWGEVNRLCRQVSLHQLLVSLLIFYIIWINIDALFAVIPNGREYVGGVGVVFVLGLAKVVNSSLSVGTDILNYSRHYPWALVFIMVLTASAIVFNNTLITTMGISGAAMATLCAYGLYYALLHGYLWRKLKVSVFSMGQLKMLVLMALLLAIDMGWDWLFGAVQQGSIVSVVARATLKTAVLGALAAGGVLLWKVSPTVNEMVARVKTRGPKL
jgi:O-antigen/teichoic acid export membrane protein